MADRSSTTNTSLSSGLPKAQPAGQTQRPNGNPPPEARPVVANIDSISKATETLGIDDQPIETLSSVDEGGFKASKHARSDGDGAVDAAVEALHAPASEISTKASSLDGKSTTSAMTFALDEKDSLRPDDSASVKATEDEDASASGGTTGANSRLGSEQGRKIVQTRFYGSSGEMGVASQQETISASLLPPEHHAGATGIGPANVTSIGHQLSLKNSVTLNGGGVPYGFSLEPDEKLVEALENPKDRLFVLRLEQDVIDFVKDSKYVDSRREAHATIS